jgi:threonine dehydratase
LAGQGTAGLELLEQVPDVDAVIIPTGGGGLLAGCAVALKTMKPSIKIIVRTSIQTYEDPYVNIHIFKKPVASYDNISSLSVCTY